MMEGKRVVFRVQGMNESTHGRWGYGAGRMVAQGSVAQAAGRVVAQGAAVWWRMAQGAWWYMCMTVCGVRLRT